MNDPFKLEIISPEKTFLTDNPKSVTVPAFEGDMTILKDHVPVITFLRPRIIQVLTDKERKYFFTTKLSSVANKN